MLQIANAQRVFSSEPPTEFDQLLLEVTDEIHREHAKVADIYFEKLQADTPVGPRQITEYYRAQVLIHFPRERLGDLMQAVVTRLERSRKPELQALAKAAKGLASAEITH